MGSSMSIIGYRKMDGEFKKMMEIKLFCDEQKVSYPKEVNDYFGNYADESEHTIISEMTEIKIPTHKIDREMTDGYEVVVSEIPEECEKIAFYMSY